MFESLGAFIYRRHWGVLAATGALLVVAVWLLARGGALTGGTIRGLEAARAERLAEEALGHSSDTTFVAVFSAEHTDLTEAELRTAVAQAVVPLRKHPAVQSVLSPADVPSNLGPRLVNPEARSAFAIVTLSGTLKRALRAYPEVRGALRSDRASIACTGRIPFLHDLGATLAHDLERAELISLPLALLVLLLVFRTAVAAVLPVGVGALAVLGGVATVLALSHHIDIAEYTLSVCSLVGLGVAIDYALFMVARYREELALGRNYQESLKRTLATAGRVVSFSGAAVGTGLSGLLFFEGSYLRSMGIGGTIVVALALLFALTFLPALLAVLGPRIHAGALPLARIPASSRGFWRRTATWVMRRPVTVLVPTLAVLLCMGIPFFHLRMTASDVRVLPEGVEARRGYDLLRRDFPEQTQNRMLVAVQFPSSPALTPERVAALLDASRSLARLPNVQKVESAFDTGSPSSRENHRRLAVVAPQTVGRHVVLLHVLTDLPSDSDEARRLVREIRKKRAVADGTLLVGGPTANDVDTTAYILERAPRAVGFVVGVTLVTLFFLLGSVLLPIKAVVMNFLSLIGSFGALVWVFQDGNLFVAQGRPLEPSLPVLLFCISFGLSMDYEVLMLARIKESYERSGDNNQAVADGLEKSAGLITSAALIMVTVFSAFTLARVVLIQAVGFGMALAVAVDATLVRVLLVPATMRLLGNANWWAPEPLLALRRRLGAIGGSTKHR